MVDHSKAASLQNRQEEDFQGGRKHTGADPESVSRLTSWFYNLSDETCTQIKHHVSFSSKGVVHSLVRNVWNEGPGKCQQREAEGGVNIVLVKY